MKKNICYKAAERFFIATRNEGQGVHINIDKVILLKRDLQEEVQTVRLFLWDLIRCLTHF